jgi:hypothetical protein
MKLLAPEEDKPLRHHYVSLAAIRDPSKLTPTKQLEFPTQALNSKAQWVKVKTLVDTGASAGSNTKA